MISLCLSLSVYYECLSVSHTVLLFGSMSLCPLVSFRVCPPSVSNSHYTACLFCVTMSTAVFYCLSTACQYLTVYRLLAFWVTVSTAVFYSLSTICLCLILYRLLILCHSVHWCLLQSVHCLSIPHTVGSVGFVSLCPLLSSRVCPMSVSTSHCTVSWFCVTFSIASFYSLSTDCQYLTPYCLLLLCYFEHCSLLQSVHCLSVTHTVPSLGSVSLCKLLPSTVCPSSVTKLHCTVCWFCVTMSTAVF